MLIKRSRPDPMRGICQLLTGVFQKQRDTGEWSGCAGHAPLARLEWKKWSTSASVRPRCASIRANVSSREHAGGDLSVTKSTRRANRVKLPPGPQCERLLSPSG